MNIVEGPARVTQLMKDCITAEMTEGGLLEDVNTFIPSYKFNEEIEEPAIGIFEQETVPVVSGTLSKKIELQTPFEFICIVYDDEDIEQSEIKGKNLACRVAASIAKNFTRITIDGKSVPILKPTIESIYPVGTVEVQDKGEEAVATSIRIRINYYVDWLVCMRNQG
jgi:hypothetical protein